MVIKESLDTTIARMSARNGDHASQMDLLKNGTDLADRAAMA
jgi:hypothetical protein